MADCHMGNLIHPVKRLSLGLGRVGANGLPFS